MIMNRKDFFARVGFGAAALLVPACIAGLATSCSDDDKGNVTPAPTGVNFTIDTSSGSLSTNGGFITQNGIVVARTNSGSFIAVSASCPHAGTNVNYVSSNNSFHCPNHGANFNNAGEVKQGPATSNLRQYNTMLTGTTLRVYS
jgi:cytochrome b6-f complex iron-sulfur subunit